VRGIIGPYSDRFGERGRRLDQSKPDLDFDRSAGWDFLAGWDHGPRPLASVLRSKDHERCLTHVFDFELVAARLADGDRSQVERIRIDLEPGKRRLVGDLWRLILESLDFGLPLLLPLARFEIIREDLERFLSLLPRPPLLSPRLLYAVCGPFGATCAPNQDGKRETTAKTADRAPKRFQGRVLVNSAGDAGVPIELRVATRQRLR